MTRAKYYNPSAIVTTDWLEKHVGDENLRIFDCTTHLVQESGSSRPYRVVSGQEDYSARHIPGSGYLDLQADFSLADSPWAMTLASTGDVAKAFEKAGVSDETRVVLYSHNSMSWATRFWWMLHWLGFDNAAVLDGGLNKWVAEGKDVTTKVKSYLPGTLAISPRPRIFVGREEVLCTIKDPKKCTISALGPDIYSGKVPRYGRPGRIPASVNVPQVSLVDPKTLEFQPAETVAQKFLAVGADPKKHIITYCGGGIFASLNAFLLHQLGYENVSVYDNSMSEWGQDNTLPIEADL